MVYLKAKFCKVCPRCHATLMDEAAWVAHMKQCCGVVLTPFKDVSNTVPEVPEVVKPMQGGSGFDEYVRQTATDKPIEPSPLDSPELEAEIAALEAEEPVTEMPPRPVDGVAAQIGGMLGVGKKPVDVEHKRGRRITNPMFSNTSKSPSLEPLKVAEE